MSVKQLSVFLENKKGRLYKALNMLKKEDIDIRALSMADTSDFGILRMIVSDPAKAKIELEEQRFSVSLADVLAVEVNDTPGGLEKVLEILSGNDMNVEYIYAFVEKKTQKALVVLNTMDNDKTEELLSNENFSILTQQEVYEL